MALIIQETPLLIQPIKKWWKHPLPPLMIPKPEKIHTKLTQKLSTKTQAQKKKNPSKEQMSTPVAQTPEEIPKENENVDTPSAKQSHAQKCLNLIFNTKNKNDVDTEQIKTAGKSYANFFDLETDLKLEDDGKYNLSPPLFFQQ